MQQNEDRPEGFGQMQLGAINPEGFPITPNYALRFRVWALESRLIRIQALIKLFKRGRYEYVPLERVLTTASDGTAVTAGFMLQHGELLSVTVSPGTAGDFLEPADYFCAVDIGLASDATPATVVNFTRFASLFSGYFGNAGIAWQHGMGSFNTEMPVHGAPFILENTPSPGTDFTYTIPTNSTAIIRAFAGLLSASATPGNRQVTFQQNLWPSSYFSTYFNVNQAASTLNRYQLGSIQGTDLVSTTIPDVSHTRSIPLLRIPGGGQLQTATTGLDGGDQWEVALLMERWVRPPATL